MASYEKSNTGKWSVRFRCVENFESKNKRLSGFNTKKDAEKAYFEYLKQYEQNDVKNIKINSITFPQLCEEYKQYQKTRIKESSIICFWNKVDLHIFPYFEKCKVKDISPRILIQWQNTLNSYSYEYKTGIRTCLFSLLKYADRYYNIPNQLTKVEGFRQKSKKQEMLIWSEEEFKQFINCVDDLEYKTFFMTLYLTGARKGELLALTWQDIDFVNSTININKSLTNKTASGSYAITSPKNATSNRIISIPSNLQQILKEWKDIQSAIITTDVVFGYKTPLPSTTIDRRFYHWCEIANVKKIRIHDFRHCHASYLIGNGISIVAVAKRLGHSNIEQTLNTYSHLIPQEENLLLKKLEEI